MKVSAVNNQYTVFKAGKKSYINPNDTEKKEDNSKINSTLIALGIASAILVGKNAGKLKDVITKAVNAHRGKTYIVVPLNRPKVELDAKALRKLPKEIRSQAIEALNKAVTTEDMNAVIRQFGIAK